MNLDRPLETNRTPPTSEAVPATDNSANVPRDGNDSFAHPPAISLPKGGGAIRGIGEKFAANPVTGTAAVSVPIAISPGRAGFGPRLVLSYNSGAGNGTFGIGWSLSIPAITRKTDKGLPRYDDAAESDVYILSDAEDLVPVLKTNGTRWSETRNAGGVAYRVDRYRPRIEGLFARIERWLNTATEEIHWRTISRDNVTTLYGKDNNSRIFDPDDPSLPHPRRIFSWLICESYDDKGNAIAYEYVDENVDNVDRGQANERNRVRTANRYVKCVKYGNRVSRLVQPDLSTASWLFEVVFDYDDGHYDEIPLDPNLPEDEQHRFVLASAKRGEPWRARPDPFSAHRAGFEVRTYRRCRRVLMFHHIPDLPTGEKGYEGLVRSTEFDYADLDYSKPVTIEEELAHQGSTRIASFLCRITQSGFVRDEAKADVVRNGVHYATYLRKSLPPLEFDYSKASIDDQILNVDSVSLKNLPAGIDGDSYQFIDLHGEGLSGVLTEQGDAWFYKRNLSPLPLDDTTRPKARFAPVDLVATKPSFDLSGRQAQFMDLAGDGQPDLVVLDGPTPGFFEHDCEEGWKNFRPFKSRVNLDSRDPNLRLIDLDGDGHADILITQDDVLVWYQSLAEDGFGEARRVAQSIDEEKGPRLIFADRAQSIYLADMCGDGLVDLVRIRNGEVCYWPNAGFGSFGAKVTLDNVKRFAPCDQFDQQRIRLADIDGSGTTDIIYLDRRGAQLYFNQAGNRLSQPRALSSFPDVQNTTKVMTADLLGNGTACLVWSSALPADAPRRMRYIDLMGGTKPHLMVRIVNNLGAETEVQYAPSTKFYLVDEFEGRPWITRLPFPVQVIERVTTRDRVSGNRFVTRYAYHHGYFDDVEREFRGFGLVEQWDTEEFATLTADGKLPSTNVEASSHVPPVLTRTWFHTGAYFGCDNISNIFAGLLHANDPNEYFREPGMGEAEVAALLLRDTELPDGLTETEEREACRALKGSMLRREVYALDGTDRQPYPYTVTEQNFSIRMLQGQKGNRHGIFLTHPREALNYLYERNPSDPRVNHSVTLEVDEFGNVLKSASVGYGRRLSDPVLAPADQSKQTELLITHSENRVTNAIDLADAYRTPLPCESQTFELSGLKLPVAARHFTFDQISDATATANEIGYEVQPTHGQTQKRLIECVRTYYRKDDLKGSLPLCTMQSLALPFETQKLAFTPGLVSQVYGSRTSDVMFDEAGYVHSEGDTNWWIPSGHVSYSPDPTDTPAQELVYARKHFFLPMRYRDPFHTTAVPTESNLTYDAYDLLIEETRDALDNRATVGERDLNPIQPLISRAQNYRVLQPAMVMDANRNRSAVAFDALGMVVGTAAMGKPAPSPAQGDSLNAYRADLTQSEIDKILANPKGPLAASLLADATTRAVYDFTAYWNEPNPARKPPAVVATLVRETHASDLQAAEQSKLQASLAYSDGFGREVQKKIQAEPGPVPQRDTAGKVILGADGQPVMSPNQVSPRWVGSGWIIFNNKGKPVRQYEPFFTDSHRFELDVGIGISPILFYDPVGRVVATLHPNHTWEKLVFDAWRQESWDVNDTLLIADPRADADVGDFFNRVSSVVFFPTWHALRTDSAHAANFATQYPDATDRTSETHAAEKTRIHAATPTVAHADALGRAFLTVAHNKFKYSDTPVAAPPVEEFHQTRIALNIEGNQREVLDAEGRTVVRYSYDMLGNRVRHASMEAGGRWVLTDAAGKSPYAWDDRDHRFRTAYDQLRRPTDSFLSENGSAEVCVSRTIYGEIHPSYPVPETNNIRGKIVELRDQAGILFSDKYDFKGNLKEARRRLATEYKSTLNWSGAVQLEAQTYTSRTSYDAINRTTQQIAPHSSEASSKVNVIQPRYNEAGLLDAVDAWLNQNAEPGSLLNPGSASLHAVTNIVYDAKGQRQLIDYGNGVRTTYTYDPLTLRLSHLLTRRVAADFVDDCPLTPEPGWPGCQVQNLHYSYDPVGNITNVRDDAQQKIFFRNKRVEPSGGYTYDAVYRLREATGREHLGQLGNPPVVHSYDDAARVGILHPGDGTAMGRYLERYVYDTVGNIVEMQHRGSDPAHPGWTRTYAYNEASQLELGEVNNRLTRTSAGSTVEIYSSSGDGYDDHGNMLRMPHLQILQWDFKDQLHMTQRQAVNAMDSNGVARSGQRTWYAYDAAGQRVRKVTEDAVGRFKDERIYLGGFEIYRQADAVLLIRETLHITDDRQRIALVETRTQGSDSAPQQLIRYQIGNQLGSAVLELDEQAQIITYEEYTPYGSTSYEAVRSQTQTPKRYRYAGKERDEESGLCYHGARYYAPWFARWTACDPAGLRDGVNAYAYVEGRPIIANDPTGGWLNIVVGAVIGAVVGGGIELARQVISGEEINLRRIGTAAAGGLVGGAIAGATFGASLAVQVAGVAAGAAIGGAVTRTLNDEPTTPGAVALDVGIALATFGLLRGAGAAWGRFRAPAGEGVPVPRGGAAKGGARPTSGEVSGKGRAGGAGEEPRVTRTTAPGEEPPAAKAPAPAPVLPELTPGDPGKMLREAERLIMQQPVSERARLLEAAVEQIKKANPEWVADKMSNARGGGTIFANPKAGGFLWINEAGEIFQARQATAELWMAALEGDVEAVKSALKAAQGRMWVEPPPPPAPAPAPVAAPATPSPPPTPTGPRISPKVPSLSISAGVGTQADQPVRDPNQKGVIILSW